jgi:hypothetical protein
MQIFIRIKAAGKKKDVLQLTPYEINDNISTLRELLTDIVITEVNKYNNKNNDTVLTAFISQEQIDDLSLTGKVSFGDVFNDKKAEKNSAINNAIQCFEDGIVRVFMDETELAELDAPLTIKENEVFTFIRLAFLAGRMW